MLSISSFDDIVANVRSTSLALKYLWADICTHVEITPFTLAIPIEFSHIEKITKLSQISMLLCHPLAGDCIRQSIYVIMRIQHTLVKIRTRCYINRITEITLDKKETNAKVRTLNNIHKINAISAIYWIIKLRPKQVLKYLFILRICYVITKKFGSIIISVTAVFCASQYVHNIRQY